MSWTICLPSCLFFILAGSVTSLGAPKDENLIPAPKQDAAPVHFEKGNRELGMWVWEDKYIRDETERHELLDFCKRWGIGRLLVQIHPEPDKLDLESSADIGTFLSEAGSKGIKVEALDGESEMGLEDHRVETLRRLDAVLAFNALRPQGQGFAGIHYDIEPYLGARWKAGDIRGVMLENLATFRAIREDIKQKAPALTLAYDIPAWYDRKTETKAVEFESHIKSFQEHIQDLSDYVGIMSYRRKATGPNSVTEISSPALQYAEKTGKTVYPALETGFLKDDPNISFYGTTPDVLIQTVDGVCHEFAGSPAFGGVLLHHYTSLRKLLEAQPGASPIPH